jgi:hypothetical protein
MRKRRYSYVTISFNDFRTSSLSLVQVSQFIDSHHVEPVLRINANEPELGVHCQILYSRQPGDIFQRRGLSEKLEFDHDGHGAKVPWSTYDARYRRRPLNGAGDLEIMGTVVPEAPN